MRSGLIHARLAIVALPAAAACLPASVDKQEMAVGDAIDVDRATAAASPNRSTSRHIATHRGEPMAAANAACESCHAEVASEWRASLHRASWMEPSFQRAFEREPLPFCQGCHVPEARPDAPPSAALGELGTGCVTCHLVEDGVLAARRSEASPPVSAAHPVLRDGRLDGDAACDGCHQYAFPPGGAPLGPDTPMQSTVSEHVASPAAEQSCASCHMQREGDHRSHRFSSSRDEARLRAAVHVDAARSSATSASITLTSNVRGHAFPTGDLFRRVEVLVEAVAPGEVLLASDAKYLARHFPFVPVSPGGPRHRAIGADDRLGAEPRTLVFDLGAAAVGKPIRYRVSYQRVAHPRSGDESASELDGEVELASGQLAP